MGLVHFKMIIFPKEHGARTMGFDGPYYYAPTKEVAKTVEKGYLWADGRCQHQDDANIGVAVIRGTHGFPMVLNGAVKCPTVPGRPKLFRRRLKKSTYSTPAEKVHLFAADRKSPLIRGRPKKENRVFRGRPKKSTFSTPPKKVALFVAGRKKSTYSPPAEKVHLFAAVRKSPLIRGQPKKSTFSRPAQLDHVHQASTEFVQE